MRWRGGGGGAKGWYEAFEPRRQEAFRGFMKAMGGGGGGWEWELGMDGWMVAIVSRLSGCWNSGLDLG